MGSNNYGHYDYHFDDLVIDQNDKNYSHRNFEKEHFLNFIKNNPTLKNISDSKILKQIKTHAFDQNDDEHEHSLGNRYSYDFIFSNICRTRFKYLVTRFLITFSVFITILDYLFYKTFD